jgi:CheY-like chemotaxis protein
MNGSDRLTILLLEDNVDLAFMLRQVLEWRGYVVISGMSGEEGLQLLGSTRLKPDLILCDLLMPDMDGYTFLSRLRVNDAWAGIPFVVMSAHDSQEMAEDAAARDAQGYLAKPFGLEDLDTLLSQCGLAG